MIWSINHNVYIYLPKQIFMKYLTLLCAAFILIGCTFKTQADNVAEDQAKGRELAAAFYGYEENHSRDSIYSMCHESFNQQEFTNLFLKKDSLFGDVFSVNILEAQTRRLNVNTDRFVKYLIKSKIIYDKGPVYEYLFCR